MAEIDSARADFEKRKALGLEGLKASVRNKVATLKAGDTTSLAHFPVDRTHELLTYPGGTVGVESATCRQTILDALGEFGLRFPRAKTLDFISELKADGMLPLGQAGKKGELTANINKVRKGSVTTVVFQVSRGQTAQPVK